MAEGIIAGNFGVYLGAAGATADLVGPPDPAAWKHLGTPRRARASSIRCRGRSTRLRRKSAAAAGCANQRDRRDSRGDPDRLHAGEHRPHAAR